MDPVKYVAAQNKPTHLYQRLFVRRGATSEQSPLKVLSFETLRVSPRKSAGPLPRPLARSRAEHGAREKEREKRGR